MKTYSDTSIYKVLDHSENMYYFLVNSKKQITYYNHKLQQDFGLPIFTKNDTPLNISDLFINYKGFESLLESIDSIFNDDMIQEKQVLQHSKGLTITFDILKDKQNNNTDISIIGTVEYKDSTYSNTLSYTPKRDLLNSLDSCKNILNSITDAVYIQDENGVFIFVNDTMNSIYGFSEEEIIGKTTDYISAPNKNNLKYISSLRTKAFNGKTQKFEFWGIKKDGNIFPNEVIVSSGYYFNKKVTVAVAHDISLHKNITEKLIEEKKKAEESDQSKSNFLANMSHEIRTPMNSILGFSELIIDTEISNDERLRFLNIINKSSYHLLDLINELVDLSKIQANQLTIRQSSFSLNGLLLEVYKHFEGHILSLGKDDKVKIELHLGLAQNSDIIVSDKTRLHQILNNIISNAVKFTAEGEIKISYEISNGLIDFSIKDSGIGIPEDQIDSIFDRYSQADISISTEYGGTGLGLAISKALTELLGGNIWCDSKLNKGTNMQFSIPYIVSE